MKIFKIDKIFLVQILGIQNVPLEREIKVKNLPFNLGCGLARSSFQFLENVIKGFFIFLLTFYIKYFCKGKDGRLGNADELRRWMQKEKIFEGDHLVWASPRVLILFPGKTALEL